jgi:hypothetical protein
MIEVVQQPRDGCLYEIRQKGQREPCYVVVPNTKVRYFGRILCFYYDVCVALTSTEK